MQRLFYYIWYTALAGLRDIAGDHVCLFGLRRRGGLLLNWIEE